MIGENFPAIAPVHFFRLSAELTGKKRLLPNTSEMLGEEHFADVSMGYNEDGIELEIEVHKKFEEAFYPKYDQGDCLELFFDTRDLKEAGFPHKFCHHFVILPQEVQGVQALEVTRFRSDDSHPHCDPSSIFVKPQFQSRSYTLQIRLPASILYGFDPKSFDRLGFTYTIHRPKYESQHFALSSQFASVSQHPSLWASLKLR